MKEEGQKLSLTGSTVIEREPATHSTPYCGINSERGKGKGAKNSGRESKTSDEHAVMCEERHGRCCGGRV